MPTRDVENRLHVHDLTEHVNGQDGLRLLRDRLFDQVRLDIPRFRIDIHEHRLAAQHQRTVGRRNEGKRRRDDFVARLDINGMQQ